MYRIPLADLVLFQELAPGLDRHRVGVIIKRCVRGACASCSRTA